MSLIEVQRALLQKSRGRLIEVGSFHARFLMSDFKWRHFQGDVILWAVRWYCRYGVSYRDLEQMMSECGVSVDHCTRAKSALRQSLPIHVTNQISLRL